MILFFDTETTGLPNWHVPSDDPSQPYIVQLAAMLTDDEEEEQSTLNCLIYPDGWTVPDDVAEIHGITTERASAGGVPIDAAMTLFFSMVDRCSIVVAHGVSFDKRLVRIWQKRAKIGATGLDAWKQHPSFCTMQKATPICRIPPTDRMMASGRKTFKTPTLGEAYEHFTGEKLEGAHDALVDMRACARVYFHLKALEAANA